MNYLLSTILSVLFRYSITDIITGVSYNFARNHLTNVDPEIDTQAMKNLLCRRFAEFNNNQANQVTIGEIMVGNNFPVNTIFQTGNIPRTIHIYTKTY